MTFRIFTVTFQFIEVIFLYDSWKIETGQNEKKTI